MPRQAIVQFRRQRVDALAPCGGRLGFSLHVWVSSLLLCLGFHQVHRLAGTRQTKKWDEGIGYQEREVFEIFLNLPAVQQKIVREVILAFARAFPAETAPDESGNRKRPGGSAL